MGDLESGLEPGGLLRWPLSFVPPKELRLPGYSYGDAEDAAPPAPGLDASQALSPLKPRARAASLAATSVARESLNDGGAARVWHRLAGFLQTQGSANFGLPPRGCAACARRTAAAASNQTDAPLRLVFPRSARGVAQARRRCRQACSLRRRQEG